VNCNCCAVVLLHRNHLCTVLYCILCVQRALNKAIYVDIDIDIDIEKRDSLFREWLLRRIIGAKITGYFLSMIHIYILVLVETAIR